MLRSQESMLKGVVRWMNHHPSSSGSRPLRVIAAVLFTLMVGSAVSVAMAQQRERSTGRLHQQPVGQQEVMDWATDNLDLVSASATKIQEILSKDPGLMVKLRA